MSFSPPSEKDLREIDTSGYDMIHSILSDEIDEEAFEGYCLVWNTQLSGSPLPVQDLVANGSNEPGISPPLLCNQNYILSSLFGA